MSKGVADFSAGAQVRLLHDPSRIGVTTGRDRPQRDRRLLQVRFPDSTTYVPEGQLEAVPESQESPIDLLADGRLGKPLDLRRVLTHARLSGRLADIIYSMEATNTDFYAYQFKPVLKILQSPTNGILVADEVGLGKTIEAGLIWTELRSRFDMRRLLVVCPAVLREKWREELRRRLEVDARIVDAAELLDTLKSPEAHIRGFALICSIQGLRPGKDWDKEDIDSSTRAELARYLESKLEEEKLVDLVVVDEAHYMRNAETRSHELGRLLREVSEYFLLLSATPVHNGSSDLFSLLNLLDPDSFQNQRAFDDVLSANRPLVQARDMILGREPSRPMLSATLVEASWNPLLRDSRALKALINDVRTADLSDPEIKGQIAYRLECVNMLGHVVTRTRKRDVVEWRVVREPHAEFVAMSEEERQIYDDVTEEISRYADDADVSADFLAVTPQRQMTSSIPAALYAWQSASFEWEGDDEEENNDKRANLLGPLASQISDMVSGMDGIDELARADTKFNRLIEVLRSIFAEYPGTKVVLFSTFRATLRYLYDRLQSEDISSIVLMGGGKVPKDEIIKQFADPDGPQVLLSSEVGGEGVDLQFCWIVVNYDLPWNPMKVEQRIGRVDRLGQESDKVLIWNIFYEDTVDARIYRRLYAKLDLCRQALGDFEAVLGDHMSALKRDLLTMHLSAAQQEARIDQTAQALVNLRGEEERLESDAAHLVAYGDYILQQVKAAKDLNRWITTEDLEAFVVDHLRLFYPGCGIRKEDRSDVWELNLSVEARHRLAEFAKSRRKPGGPLITGATKCVFRSKAFDTGTRGKVETISQFHPLVRFISDDLKQREVQLRPAVAARVRLSDVGVDLAPGIYALAGSIWLVEGAQSNERLVFAASSLDGKSLLSENDAERLAISVARSGEDWIEVSGQVNLTQAFDTTNDTLLGGLRVDYEAYVSDMQSRNLDRIEWQLANIKTHMERQLERLREVRRKHKAKQSLAEAQEKPKEARKAEAGVKMTDGRMKKLIERTQTQEAALTDRKELRTRFEEVCACLIQVV